MKAPAGPGALERSAGALVETGVWVAAGIAPLVWTIQVMGEYTLPKFFVLNVGAFLCLLGLALGAAARAPWLRPTPVARPMLACAAALAASTTLSQDRLVSLEGRYNSYAYGIWAFILYASLFWGAFLAFGERGRRRCIDLCLGAAGLVSVYALLQAAGMEPFLRPERLIPGRSISSLGSPVDLGAYLAMFLPLALARAWVRRRPLDWGVTALLAAGLYTPTSRGSWIASLGGCAAAWLILRRGGTPIPRWAKLAALAACLLLGGMLMRRTANRATAKSDSGRVEGWKIAWGIFRLHPWLGTGPDTFEQAFRLHRSEAFIRGVDWQHIHAYAHNDFLQALATTGLAGTAAYLWLLWGLWQAGRRASELGAERDALAGCAGSLGAWFLNVKLNPVALEVLIQASVCAAVIAGVGALPQRKEPARPLSAALGVLFALIAAAAAAGTYRAARLLEADYWVKQATFSIGRDPKESALPQFNKALRKNVCETAYHVQMSNHIADLFNTASDEGTKSALVDAAQAVGRRAIQCHPNAINSHYTAGFTALLGARLGREGDLDRAEAHLARAMELDSKMVPLIRLRASVAEARRDTALAAELKARADRLEEIVDKTPGRG